MRRIGIKLAVGLALAWNCGATFAAPDTDNASADGLPTLSATAFQPPDNAPPPPPAESAQANAPAEADQAIGDAPAEAKAPGPWTIPQPCFLQKLGIKTGGWVQQGITGNAWNPADRFNGPIFTNDRSGRVSC